MIEGHKMVTIGDVCLKGSSNVSQNKLLQNEGIYPIFGASGFIKNVDFYHQEKKYLSIVKDGSGVGRVTKMDAKTSVIGTLQYLIPKDNIDIDYLYYSLIRVDFKKFVSGAAIPHIYFKDYQKEPFYLVPPTEQKAIVEKLDFAFDAIEKAKANIEKNIENAKELFQSKLNAIFSQKGEGADWVLTELGKLGIITSSKRIYKSDYVTEGIPFYRTKEIKELSNGKNITLELFISEQKYIEIKNRFGVPQIGDILISAVGTIGEIMVIENDNEFYFKDGNIIWLKDFKNVNPNYLRYLLKSFVEKIKSLAIGSAYSALTIEKLNLYKVVFPSSMENQQKIVNDLDELSLQTKLIQDKYKQKLANLEELKKSILEKAFKGELV